MSDGISLLDWKLDPSVTFSSTNRTGALIIYGKAATYSGDADRNTFTPEANSVQALWLYIGKSGSNEAYSAGGSVSSPLTGRIISEQPQAAYVYQPESPQANTPRIRIPKISTETLTFYLSMTGSLLKATETFNGATDFEEVDYVKVSSVDGGVADNIEVFDATRFVYRNGETLIRLSISGGTDGDDSTLLATVATVSPDDTTVNRQILEQRFLVQIRDTSD
ncbi:MAG: hypothetical protein AAFV53_28895 [Myxococcota bacterium]